MNEALKRAQCKYFATEKGRERVKEYETSEKGRAKKRRYAQNLTPEQQEKQREAKRLSAQRRRARLKEKNLVLRFDAVE